MKGFFKKIFGLSINSDSIKDELLALENDSLEDLTLNKEDNETRFVRLFNEEGGKFLYASNEIELLSHLEEIVQESTLKNFYCVASKFKKILDCLGTSYNEKPCKEEQINLIDCEYLIAFNGGVMVSSHQTNHRKLYELSDTFVVIAYPDQIVENISAALRNIKKYKHNNIPINITTIKGQVEGKEKQNNTKNLYLILTERTSC